MKEEKDIQPIDNLFRQSLEGYSPAPPVSVWKKIRLQLSEKKSGRGTWFSSPGGLTLISALLLISSFILYKSFFAETETNNQKSTVSPFHADSAIHQQTASHIYHSSSDIQISAAAKPVLDENSKHGFQPADGTKNSGQTKPVSANLQANLDVTTAQASSNVHISSKYPWTYDNLFSILGKENIPNIISKQDAEIKLADKDFSFQANETIDAFIERSADVVVTLRQDTKKENDIVQLTEKQDKQGTDTLITPDIPGPPKPETKNRFALAGIFGNIGQVYQKDRSPHLFYGGMITGGLWNTKWEAGLETGIGFSRYNDHGIYEFEFQRSDTVGYTGYTYFNSFDSSYLFVYKPNIVDTLIYFDTITEVSYSYLKIPLYFSKQLFRSGKLSAGIKTGPSVEFMIGRTETQPEYLLEGTTLLKITNNSYTRLNTSWQWLIAPQLNWDITDKIVFRLEPSAVFYLNNLYDKTNRPSSTPYGISIIGGLIWQIK